MAIVIIRYKKPSFLILYRLLNTKCKVKWVRKIFLTSDTNKALDKAVGLDQVATMRPWACFTKLFQLSCDSWVFPTVGKLLAYQRKTRRLCRNSNYIDNRHQIDKAATETYLYPPSHRAASKHQMISNIRKHTLECIIQDQISVPGRPLEFGIH